MCLFFNFRSHGMLHSSLPSPNKCHLVVAEPLQMSSSGDESDQPVHLTKQQKAALRDAGLPLMKKVYVCSLTCVPACLLYFIPILLKTDS